MTWKQLAKLIGQMTEDIQEKEATIDVDQDTFYLEADESTIDCDNFSVSTGEHV